MLSQHRRRRGKARSKRRAAASSTSTPRSPTAHSFANQVNGQILIDGGTVNVAAGVSLGVPVTFTGAGGTLNLANAPVDVDVNGAGGAINLSHANADVTGGGFTITETGADWLAIGGNGVGGATDVVNGSGETTTTHASSNVTIVGNHDTVDVGVANALSLDGANDVLDLHELFGDTTLSGFGASDVMEIQQVRFRRLPGVAGPHDAIGRKHADHARRP